mgnify:CR=1 FL=1
MKKLLAATAIAAAVTLGGTVIDNDAKAADDMEKCYGVVKAGANDCASASGTHTCAGQAAADSSGSEWVYVPAGLCGRLAGGSTTPTS